MDITPYVDSLRQALVSAADSAGDDTRQAAERLSFALDSSSRLAIMEAVSQAAAEITAEMPNGGVDVRLNGRDLDFLVHVAVPTPPTPPAAGRSPERRGRHALAAHLAFEPLPARAAFEPERQRDG